MQLVEMMASTAELSPQKAISNICEGGRISFENLIAFPEEMSSFVRLDLRLVPNANSLKQKLPCAVLIGNDTRLRNNRQIHLEDPIQSISI